MLWVLLTFVVSGLTEDNSHLKWNYENVDEWRDTTKYPGSQCGKKGRQSPIDVKTRQEHIQQWDPQPICHTDDSNIIKFDDKHKTWHVFNDGHALMIVPTGTDGHPQHNYDNTPMRFKDPIHGTWYCLDSIRAHFGKDDGQGSEHVFYGDAFPLELQFYHYRCPGPDFDKEWDWDAGLVFKNLDHARGFYMDENVMSGMKDKNVLGVISVFYEAIKEENPAFGPIVDAAMAGKLEPHLGKPESPVDVIIDDPVRFLVNGKGEYLKKITGEGGYQIIDYMWFYEGSETGPACAEVVFWGLFKENLGDGEGGDNRIGESQLEALRGLKYMSEKTYGQIGNFRPLDKVPKNPDGPLPVYHNKCKPKPKPEEETPQ